MTILTQQLSARLKETTREAHDRAENRTFITALMAGELDRSAYTALARQHHAIYSALEEAGERLPAQAPARSLLLPELLRTKALTHDLDLLAGPRWTDLPLVPATQRYVKRLQDIADTDPGYVAHAYTRYLGDLSGGQIVRTMLQRHYDFQPEELTFYSFTLKAKPFKDHYRQLIDDLPFSLAEVAATLTEASDAFDFNSALFDDLGARL